MAEELRLALILLGSLAIGAVVLHGIWTVRKNINEERKLHAQEHEPEEEVLNEEELEVQSLKVKQMEMDFNILEASAKDGEGLPVVDMNVDSIYQQKVTGEQASENFEVNVEEDMSQLNAQADFGASQMSASISAPTSDSTPELNDELPAFSALDSGTFTNHEDTQIEMHDESLAQESVEQDAAPDSQSTQSEPQPAPSEKSEVLILYVDKPEGEMIDGARLLPILLTLGFKFGEMDFFHRHEQSSGHGEILFSLANMYNPGKFDIDNMEQVSTRGLSIFMTLPNAGEALQTFNMMHNAAKKIADEFDANVLDANRQTLDMLRVRHYVEKIRKF